MDQISAPSLTLTADGWTSVNNESIVNFSVCEPNAIFIGSVNTSDASHTAEYMSGLILKKTEEVGAEKIIALVTDNATNMRSAWGLIKEEHPHIICFGCGAHGLNLLLKDFMTLPSLANFLKSATKIVRYVNVFKGPLN